MAASPNPPPTVGTVAPATAGAFGFDIDSPITAAIAATLMASFNYTFCLRFVSRNAESSNDLTAAETPVILGAGLALMLVQHVAKAGWTPTANLGTQYGTNAAKNASNAAVPQGVSLFCDLEGVVSGTPVPVIQAYCNNWYAAVSAAGFIPGLYVGANSGLNAAQLSSLNFQLFWKSCSKVPAPLQGYAMIQNRCDVTRAGSNVDENTIAGDAGLLAWLT